MPHQSLQGHPLVQAGRDYAVCVDQWFSGGADALRSKEEELQVHAHLGVGTVKEELIGLTEAVQTLRRYQREIGLELISGLEQRAQDTDSSRAANGSVKAALLAMDSSIAAWLKMKEFFPDKSDEILSLLLQLDRLRRETESQFPRAR